MDIIKELLLYLCEALHIPINQYVEHCIGSEYMDNIKTAKINLDTKSFNISLTLLYTLITSLLILILLVFIQKLYLWFSEYSFNNITDIAIKIMAIILVVCGFILLICKQHSLFGSRIGEIIKIVNGDKEVNYNYKGYAYLFINTILTFIPLLIMFSISLFLPDNMIFISSAYIAIFIILIIVTINIFICLFQKRKRFILKISKLDKIIIHFKNDTIKQYPLYKNSYRINFIRIRYDNDIYIYELDKRECCLFEKDEIDTITIGTTILKFNNSLNKWCNITQIP